MKKLLLVPCALACVLLCGTGLLNAQMAGSPLVATDGAQSVHIMPTPEVAKQMANQVNQAGVLTYHGGKIMTSLTTYAIFWLPSTLQDGTPTSMSAKYQPVIKAFLADYPSHAITSNSTQYYQTINNVTKYIAGGGSFGGFYVDTNPYPASGCSDPVTGTNCITDAQLQTEINRVMGVKGWTGSPAAGSPTKMFLVFTSKGEGSCSGSSCAYSAYCAYHGSYTNGAGAVVVYGNEPYADPAYCFAGGQKAPSGDQPADAAVNVASHEMTEAATDPNLDAWWDSANGEEIGDLCAWTFGTLTWDGALANEMWNGHFYDLQMEYDNHTGGCVQVGP